jgi:protein-S-isoprenylcysteine O-methyltransferase Ste14
VGWFLVILAWIGQGLLVGRDGTWPGLALWQLPLHPLGLLAGLLLVVLGYAGTLWTYAAMGRSWRMGVNSKEKTELVRSGPFRWSRNPIYGLQIVMLAGVALLLPTAISLAALLLHFTCTLIKIADEEKYLARVHGPAYLEYSATTARLFPRPQPRRPGGGGKPSTCN